MTQTDIKKLQDRIARLYHNLSGEVGSSTMDMIYELVSCEQLLEMESNK